MKQKSVFGLVIGFVMEVSNKGINPVFERHATLNSQINESLQKVQWRKYSLSILLVLNGPSNIRKITHYGGCYDLCIKMAMSLNVNLDLNTFVSLRL